MSLGGAVSRRGRTDPSSRAWRPMRNRLAHDRQQPGRPAGVAGRAGQRALPNPSPSDSPLSARCAAESRRVKREIMLLLLLPYPLITPPKSREARLLVDGRCAAARAAGDSAPAFRSPLDCLFCCHRTYQDVSCWRF